MASHDAEADVSHGRHVWAYVNNEEVLALAESGVPAPPDCHLPKGWHLDLSSVPVLSLPRSAAAHDVEAANRRARLTLELWAYQKYRPQLPY
jgi:hypothetical protein